MMNGTNKSTEAAANAAACPKKYLVISDVHGHRELFYKAVNYAEQNNMVLVGGGDFSDRGHDGIDILMRMQILCSCGAARYIKGNHDAVLSKYLAGNLRPFETNRWLINGGFYTMEEANKLSSEEKTRLLQFLDEAPQEIAIGNAVLGHACSTRSICYTEPDDLYYYRPPKGDLSSLIVPGRISVFGHTPTVFLINKHDFIHIKDSNAASELYMIDLGAGWNSGILGGLVLDSSGAVVERIVFRS